MKKLQLTRKGITLIELLITLAILGIVIQVIYSIFFVGNKSFNMGKSIGFTQQDARITSELIIKELRTAKAVAINENSLGDKYCSLSNSNGKLIKTIFDKSNTEQKILFNGSLIEIKFNRTDADAKGIITVTVVAKEDNQETSFDFDVLLENLPDYSDDFKDKTKIYYTKYE